MVTTSNITFFLKNDAIYDGIGCVYSDIESGHCRHMIEDQYSVPKKIWPLRNKDTITYNNATKKGGILSRQ